eukprot:9494502-Alexandrium_andersonii.AAC.1
MQVEGDPGHDTLPDGRAADRIEKLRGAERALREAGETQRADQVATTIREAEAGVPKVVDVRRLYDQVVKHKELCQAKVDAAKRELEKLKERMDDMQKNADERVKELELAERARESVYARLRAQEEGGPPTAPIATPGSPSSEVMEAVNQLMEVVKGTSDKNEAGT